MFTGIVQTVGRVKGLVNAEYGMQLVVSTTDAFLQDLRIGASVSVDGICLTVVEIGEKQVTFDAINHTLATTNLRDRIVGDPINLERSARIGDEVGGHLVSGHVSTVGTVIALATDSKNNYLKFTLDPYWTKYISLRGFVALDGASLTVAEVNQEANTFQIALIPETIRSTA